MCTFPLTLSASKYATTTTKKQSPVAFRAIIIIIFLYHSTTSSFVCFLVFRTRCYTFFLPKLDSITLTKLIYYLMLLYKATTSLSYTTFQLFADKITEKGWG